MNSLTQDRLKFLVTYDAVSGSFVWNVRRGGKANAGSRSECMDSKGYYRIGIDGKRYLAHRLAWFYTHGEWPDGLIDHVNRVRTDNRLENLRVVPPAKNAWNRSKSSAHDNPALGVSFSTDPRRSSKWFAYITRDKKRVGLGHYATKEEAIAARLRAETKDQGVIPWD
jgi:hypothetical protein